ncbi:hypothetical protein LTR91_017882 [Friedmanniomyces endolithicus]|uniref:Kynurenine formamidase n=1 Tax=Friedmanniomyces endolithicus TaxID=329885 RepID=A0AAN6F759_9PEZI|nr:hypothetical protein LTS00_016139 [Friedmanniomyces endolithicus]KAK0273927.1 hypothetical protein LTR35_012055 [Friedmanniomyces endolithicus]KAK0307717.1 hypothetical protein LTR82_015857 [Friedmanniomyces endolithicus]KAK0926062.1 hypothetical protein LTR57_004311 [Friedmanniomyces endolithicus]KAK0965698.1 hypothetical protein LTR91_017882 [Friedmanniomyces endolithicus]
MGDAADYPQYHQHVEYSDESSLNTLDVCIPHHPPADRKQLWIIFIHGGAWLDPEIDSSSFKKTQDLLLASHHAATIAGLASLNYRLSPNPSHPQHPSNPSDPARNAKHPDHINDVLAALLYLQGTYHFEDRYVLVGHSCGATLAFQVAMKRYWGSQYESTFALELNVVPPMTVVGVEGLYDLPALVKHHSGEPEYRDFVSNAFGSDERVWAAVSPTSGEYEESWPDGRLVVLAHSREDELVEWEQVDLMQRALKAQGWGGRRDERRLELIELKGKHDQVWEEGTELARAIEATLGLVEAMV